MAQASVFEIMDVHSDDGNRHSLGESDRRLFRKTAAAFAFLQKDRQVGGGSWFGFYSELLTEIVAEPLLKVAESGRRPSAAAG